MSGKVTRRRFVHGVSSAFAASAILDLPQRPVMANHEKKVRLAFVGVGNRGTGLLKTLPASHQPLPTFSPLIHSIFPRGGRQGSRLLTSIYRQGRSASKAQGAKVAI